MADQPRLFDDTETLPLFVGVAERVEEPEPFEPIKEPCKHHVWRQDGPRIVCDDCGQVIMGGC